MITLFHRPKTRSSRVIFLLEELEAPYQIKLVTTRARDGTGAADPANPHPHGKVPAISDDGAIVFESPAIADRNSTRLNSSHRCSSYAVFCLKKKRTRSATCRM